MLLLYYIILPIPESSMSFSILHNHVACDCDWCDNFVTDITHLSYFVTYITVIYNIISYSLFKFKIIEMKIKLKIK